MITNSTVRAAAPIVRFGYAKGRGFFVDFEDHPVAAFIDERNGNIFLDMDLGDGHVVPCAIPGLSVHSLNIHQSSSQDGLAAEAELVIKGDFGSYVVGKISPAVYREEWFHWLEDVQSFFNKALPAGEVVPGALGIATPFLNKNLGSLSVPFGANVGEHEIEPISLTHVIRGRRLEDGTVVATGRRKTAVARVRVKRGTGKFLINGRSLTDFFPVENVRLEVLAPLNLCALRNDVDVWVRVDGGGVHGQAGAIVLGLSRALHHMRNDLHPILSENGFLTRDDRMVERKKYGHKKARRSFQFSKR